jgi:tetratricopeptide (TPR) repeat protein
MQADFTTVRRGVSAIFGALLLAAQVAHAAPEPDRFVIGPGNEQAVSAMAGMGGIDVGGCSLEGAAIARTNVALTYACAGAPAALTLVHPSAAPEGAVVTEKLAVAPGDPAPPKALLDAVVARVREHEGAFAWQELAPQAESDATVPSVPEAPKGFMNDEQRARYDRAVQRYKSGDVEGAYDDLYALAHETPRGVLGTLVAALASRSPSEELVRELTAAADADPDDPVKQFVAGVGAHYRGHQSGRSREEKARYYEITLRYLKRVEALYAEEPRLWIYLAVSYFRTGRQAEAEAAIEKAVALGSDDADAWYCRAEIYHKKDPEAAVADMKRYLAIMEENRKKGSIFAESKEKRVKEMLAHMERVARGELPADAEELFDPPKTSLASLLGDLPPLAFVVAGVALLAGLALVVTRLRRRRGVGSGSGPPT